MNYYHTAELNKEFSHIMRSIRLFYRNQVKLTIVNPKMLNEFKVTISQPQYPYHKWLFYVHVPTDYPVIPLLVEPIQFSEEMKKAFTNGFSRYRSIRLLIDALLKFCYTYHAKEFLGGRIPYSNKFGDFNLNKMQGEKRMHSKEKKKPNTATYATAFPPKYPYRRRSFTNYLDLLTSDWNRKLFGLKKSELIKRRKAMASRQALLKDTIFTKQTNSLQRQRSTSLQRHHENIKKRIRISQPYKYYWGMKKPDKMLSTPRLINNLEQFIVSLELESTFQNNNEFIMFQNTNQYKKIIEEMLRLGKFMSTYTEDSDVESLRPSVKMFKDKNRFFRISNGNAKLNVMEDSVLELGDNALRESQQLRGKFCDNFFNQFNTVRIIQNANPYTGDIIGLKLRELSYSFHTTEPVLSEEMCRTMANAVKCVKKTKIFVPEEKEISIIFTYNISDDYLTEDDIISPSTVSELDYFADENSDIRLLPSTINQDMLKLINPLPYDPFNRNPIDLLPVELVTEECLRLVQPTDCCHRHLSREIEFTLDLNLAISNECNILKYFRISPNSQSEKCDFEFLVCYNKTDTRDNNLIVLVKDMTQFNIKNKESFLKLHKVKEDSQIVKWFKLTKENQCLFRSSQRTLYFGTISENQLSLFKYIVSFYNIVRCTEQIKSIKLYLQNYLQLNHISYCQVPFSKSAFQIFNTISNSMTSSNQ